MAFRLAASASEPQSLARAARPLWRVCSDVDSPWRFQVRDPTSTTVDAQSERESMSERERARERDLVLAPNEYAFISDETKAAHPRPTAGGAVVPRKCRGDSVQRAAR